MDIEEHKFSDEEDYNSDIDTYEDEDKEEVKKIDKDNKSKDDDDDEIVEDDDAMLDKETEEDDNDNDNYDDEDDEDIHADDDDIILDDETPDDTIEYIVKEEDRITSDYLSKYEMIELINIRATQISKGDYPFTDVKNLRDPISMAKKEVYDNRCPLLVKRAIGNNKFEIWNPNLMFKPKI